MEKNETLELLEEMSGFFNERAEKYDEVHLGHVGGIENKNIIATFLPEHTKTLIDFGIGTGLELNAIFERFPDVEVTGIDIAANMLEQLKANYPDKKINLHCISYLDFDFGINLYDVALSVMTLHHYTHEVKLSLYRKIYNSLRENGVYIENDYMLSEHEHENPQEMEDFYFAEYQRLLNEQNLDTTKEYHYDTPCTVINQKKLLLQAGFKKVNEVWRRQGGNAVILVAEK